MRYRVPYSISIEGELQVEAASVNDAYAKARTWLMKNKDAHQVMLEQGVGTQRIHRQEIEVLPEPKPFVSELHERYTRRTE